MILYHGSNVSIDAIDLSKSRPGKDFGTGFYLSADENQAIEMAESKVAFLGGEPVVTSFEFDESILSSNVLKDSGTMLLRVQAVSLAFTLTHAVTSLHSV